jgi:DNA invertase Pin-like site-specific DNA recombinase
VISPPASSRQRVGLASFACAVSTSDRGQTVENQLQPLQEAAERLGWTVVAISTATRASVAPRGATGGLGWMLCSRASPGEFDIVAAWSVCRLGRSLPDLIGPLSELRSREIDLYLHRVMAGPDRARSSGKRLGRPRTTPFKIDRIRAALDEGRGVRETARLLKVSATKVSEIRRMSAATIDLHPSRRLGLPDQLF